MTRVTPPTDEARATLEALPTEAVLQRRLDAIRDHKWPKSGHPIVPLDGNCAVCGDEIYESRDPRGHGYRHGWSG